MAAKNTIVRMKDVSFDPQLLKPMKMQTTLDNMFSHDGGIFPATNYLLIGDPGVGKTTLGLEVLSLARNNDKNLKTLFICAEMSRVDMFGYVKRYPSFANIDILFLSEHLGDKPANVIETVLENGYDLVLADSFVELQDVLNTYNEFTRTQAEKWLLDLLVRHNRGQNKKHRYTAFILIQQVTKTGEFVGSNKLKHFITGMAEARYSTAGTGERFIHFSKNRRGCKHERLYFTLTDNNVKFDTERLEREEQIKNILKKEEELMNSAPDISELFKDEKHTDGSTSGEKPELISTESFPF